MLHFVTLFDINYLTRGLVLLNSLKETSSEPFTLYVIALDKNVVSYFDKMNEEKVVTIPLTLLEKKYPELLTAKNNRSVVEYYFTLSPFLPLYVLDSFADVHQVTSMDSDLYFFNDPAIIFQKYPDASVLITPHNLSENLQWLSVNGRYNVSFQSFKNDKDGRSCLRQWKEQCIEWCYDYLDKDNNRYADQKYLDAWPDTFNVQEINLPGAGLAPWNVQTYSLTMAGRNIYVNNEPLIFFHFHHLRIFNRFFAINGLNHYGVNILSKPLKSIYHTYLKKLSSTSRRIDASEKSVNRINYARKGLFNTLMKADGYWLFTSHFIIPVNLQKKIKHLFRKFTWHN